MAAPRLKTTRSGGAALRAGLLDPRDPEWAAALKIVSHDCYHLPSYVEFASRWDAPGAPCAFIAEEDGRVLLVPVLVREIPVEISAEPGWFDATGPRGYPGPVAGPDDAGDRSLFLGRAIGALIETLRERRIVSAFIRCHPVLSPAPDLLRQGGTIVEHGESVSMDLAVPPAETWSRIRENHRRDITRARQDGYQMRDDVAWERLDDFLAIHAAAMERLEAAQEWRIGEPYVAELRAALGPRLHLCVAERAGDLAAAALVTEVDGMVEYHLAATAPGHAAASPSKFLIEAISRWARDRGNRVFHLAGSVRPDDALIHFKRGFSSERHPVMSWRIVSDPDAYQRFVARRSSTGHDAPAGRRPADAFFPEYRR